MLVISQKKGEKIHIGRDITISIIDIKSGKVRIGIEAPSDCPVLRDALLKDKVKEGTSQEQLLKTRKNSNL